jgi:hypothetical protein
MYFMSGTVWSRVEGFNKVGWGGRIQQGRVGGSVCLLPVCTWRRRRRKKEIIKGW